MTIRKTSRVTLTVTGYSEENVRNQVADHFGFENPQPPMLSETVKTHKLTFVKMLRDFEKKFYVTKDEKGLDVHKTCLIELKKFVEQYFAIS